MKRFLILFFLLIFQQSFSQSIFVCRNGEVTFFSSAPVEDIEATSKSMNSILNTSNNEIVFVVPMTSFKFQKGLMQEHFNEKYVESDKFPNATYKGKIAETIDYSKDGEYTINSEGTLTIHGVEKPRKETGKLVISNGEIRLQSEFSVAVDDHKIEIPQLMMQNIADTVKVNFVAKYSPYKKEK